MARHLVETLSAQGRQNLWRSADMMLRDGGSLYLQFLTHSGSDGYAKATRVRPRRPDAVAAELEAAGATIVHREILPVTTQGGAGAGVPSKICRMVAQWER
jgi:hypothetical protein